MLPLIAALAVLGAQQQVPPLSAFAAAKARTLIRDQLPCLGCHQLDGEGGRIGPDLSNVGSRLSGAAIYSMIANPGGTRPGTLMPRIPMPETTARLVAAYLASLRSAATPGAAAVTESTGGTRPAARTTADGAALYARHCVACHGASGRGDGPNAAFLPVQPANHGDRDSMASRTDDRLFDAIAAGGAPLGRSPRMPAFGLTLTPGEIRSLVRHIRQLCRCEGPAWSRDGGPP